jgi:hypothetical protein
MARFAHSDSHLVVVGEVSVLDSESVVRRLLITVTNRDARRGSSLVARGKNKRGYQVGSRMRLAHLRILPTPLSPMKASPAHGTWRSEASSRLHLPVAISGRACAWLVEDLCGGVLKRIQKRVSIHVKRGDSHTWSLLLQTAGLDKTGLVPTIT